jgi:hypothetical protein
MVISDKGKLLEFENTGSITLTIPTNAAAAFDIGDRVDVLLTSTGSLSIVGDTGVTLNAEGDLTTIASQWTRVTLIKRGTNSWVLTGSGAEVQTVEIENGAVTEAKLASNSVTSAKIVDGTIVNADINASAAIALSKLATSTAGNIIVYNASGVPTAVAETGDITISDTGVTAIASGVIVNADINASAAIAHSKLANATDGQLLLGTTTTGVVTATTVTGDVTITGAGVTAISSGVIVNADINASAAIALTKLATGTQGTVIVHNASGVPTATAISGDITISDTGVATIAANSVALGTDTTGNYMSDLTQGTGVTITHTPGEGSNATIAIGQAIGTSASVTFSQVTTTGNIVVGGDLTVNGTTTTLNTDTLAVEDNIIVLNSNVTATPALNAGVEVERGTSANVLVRWNETNDKWEVTNDGTTYGNIVTTSSSTVEATSANTANAVVSRDASGNFSAGTATLTSASVSGRFDGTSIREAVVDSSVSASVVTADYSTGDIFYVGTAPSSNFTVNLTNAPTDNGKAITVVIFVTQGATGYIPNAVQVAGSAQTIKWANGAAPTPTSSAGKIDIFSFTFVRRSSAWTVFGSSNLGY